MKLKPKKKPRKVVAPPRSMRGANPSPLVELATRITDEALALAEEEAGSESDLDAVDRMREFLRDRLRRKPAAIEPGDHRVVSALLEAAIERGRDVDQFAKITLVALTNITPRLPPAFHEWRLPAPALFAARRVAGRGRACTTPSLAFGI